MARRLFSVHMCISQPILMCVSQPILMCISQPILMCVSQPILNVHLSANPNMHLSANFNVHLQANLLRRNFLSVQPDNATACIVHCSCVDFSLILKQQYDPSKISECMKRVQEILIFKIFLVVVPNYFLYC